MKSTSKLGRDGRFWGLVMIAPTIIGLMILNIIPFFQTMVTNTKFTCLFKSAFPIKINISFKT